MTKEVFISNMITSPSKIHNFINIKHEYDSEKEESLLFINYEKGILIYNISYTEENVYYFLLKNGKQVEEKTLKKVYKQKVTKNESLKQESV